MPVDAASCRDYAGHVFQSEDKIYRTILPRGLAGFSAVRENGGLSALVDDGQVIDGVQVDPKVLVQFARN